MAKGKTRFRVTGKEGIDGLVTMYTERLKREAAAIAREAAQVGAEAMQERILNSATGYRERDTPNADPRAVSGAMFDAVEYDKTSKWDTSGDGTDTRKTRFGWISTFEDYFYYQEQGFNNTSKTNASRDGGPAGYTLPMHAVVAGRVAAREHIKKRLKKVRIR